MDDEVARLRGLGKVTTAILDAFASRVAREYEDDMLHAAAAGHGDAAGQASV